MSVLHETMLHRGLELTLLDVECRAHRGAHMRDEATTHHEIVFVRRGMFLIDVRGERLVASPNHIVRLEPDQPYRVVHPLDGGDACTVVRLAPGVFDVLCEGRSAGRLARSLHAPAPTRAFLRQHRLWRVLSQHGDALRIEESLCALLDEAFGSLDETAARSVSSALERIQRDRVAQVIALLTSRLGEQLRLAEIALAVQLSPFHLARLFRRRTGLPIHRYLISLRLREALVRLDAGERDLTKLALDLGFFDHSHFTTAFRREFGVAPSYLRSMNPRASLALGQPLQEP